MYVGHYGAALALNSVERKASLWLLFLGGLWRTGRQSLLVRLPS